MKNTGGEKKKKDSLMQIFLQQELGNWLNPPLAHLCFAQDMGSVVYGMTRW